jgi:hypothetical protein
MKAAKEPIRIKVSWIPNEYRPATIVRVIKPPKQETPTKIVRVKKL